MRSGKAWGCVVGTERERLGEEMEREEKVCSNLKHSYQWLRSCVKKFVDRTGLIYLLIIFGLTA